MVSPIIGIAANQLVHATETFNGNLITYTPQGFVDAVQKADGIPLLLPMGNKDTVQVYVDKIDKLLLAGGQDVDPRLYHEEPHPKLEETNIHRDDFEAALIKETIRQQKPIFTVCRGTQLLNVVLGGTLYQDLSLYKNWHVKHAQQPTAPWLTSHQIRIEENSRLRALLPEQYFVNSFHHQAIKVLAEPLKATAFADDGIIEAVESKDEHQRILGVQWHPELTHKMIDSEQDLFNYFVHSL